ncbi:MAG: ribonuclease [Actinomycetota bacterium]|nr:ribonuclease [Actinomycetota bacterium]
MTTIVFTDGACLGNPGPGGWAWAVPGGRFASGAEARSTNQRMEIKAVLEAVRALAGSLEVVSDSTYVVNCFRDRWWEAWLARGWINSAKKPVANRDLWEPLIEAVRADPDRVRFRWVKGHSGDVSNDLVDRLAVEAARTQQGRTGAGTPAGLGPPDDPGAATGATAGKPGSPDPRLPAGHLVAVTGHRPPELGGYDVDNPVAAGVRDKLAEVLAAKRQLHPDLVVVTGLGLGAEQLAAEAAEAAGVPFVAVLPYPDPDDVWPADAKRRFRLLLDRAVSTVVVQAKKPATKQLAGAALRRRDGWIASHASEAVVVWDGDDPGVGRSVRALQDALGEDEVWVIPPPGEAA